MDRSDVGRSLLGESPQVTRLRARHLEVVERLTGELAEARRSVPLVGLAVRNAELRRLAPRAQHTVRVMQTDYAFDPEDPGLDLSSGLATRGVSTELITRPTTPRTHPLLSSIYPGTLLGPVFVPCLVIDDHTALVAGPDDAFGNRVAWRTHVPEVIEELLDIWHETVPMTQRLLDHGHEPPLTERQLGVARLLCTGEKDKAIARLLELSPRTVEREVSALLRVLGATSRTEAVLAMLGRAVNSGGPVAPPVGPTDDGPGSSPA